MKIKKNKEFKLKYKRPEDCPSDKIFETMNEISKKIDLGTTTTNELMFFLSYVSGQDLYFD